VNNDSDSINDVDPQNRKLDGDRDENRPESPRRLGRRRSFVAYDVAQNAERIRTRLARSFDDDDLPVLTDVAAEPDGDAIVAGVDAGTLTRLVEQRLNEVLPGLLQAALSDVGLRLQRQIEADIGQTLRQFLAQHSPAPAAGRETGPDAAAGD